MYEYMNDLHERFYLTPSTSKDALRPVLSSAEDSSARRRLFHTKEGERRIGAAAVEAGMAPVEMILMHCVVEPLLVQAREANAAVLFHFMEVLQLPEHLAAARRYLLLGNGEFAHALSGEIRAGLLEGRPLLHIARTSCLDALVSASTQDRDPFASNLTFVVDETDE